MARRVCSEPAAGQESVFGLHQEAQNTRSMSPALITFKTRGNHGISMLPGSFYLSEKIVFWGKQPPSSSDYLGLLARFHHQLACVLLTLPQRRRGQGEGDPHPSFQLLLSATCMQFCPNCMQSRGLKRYRGRLPENVSIYTGQKLSSEAPVGNPSPML